jgi:hypothetical protein
MSGQKLRGSAGAHQGLDGGPADQNLRRSAGEHTAVGGAYGDGHRGRADPAPDARHVKGRLRP